MCFRCDYEGLLESSGLDYTQRRFRVMEIIGNSSSPLSAQEIYETLSRTEEVNRVTIYRILDLLVGKKLVERISSGDRSFRFGLAPNENHLPHHHFYCTRCGVMECLGPNSLQVHTESLVRTFPGVIDRIQVSLEGTCKTCIKLIRH